MQYSLEITLVDLTEKLRLKEKNLGLIFENLQNRNIIKMVEKSSIKLKIIPSCYLL